MDIHYFREFVTLADTGNFLEASEELYISQSSLSKHIKKLELELGAPLFIRTAKKLELTEFGRILFSDAVRLCSLQDHYLEQLSEYKQKQRSQSLSLGLTPLNVQYHLTTLLSEFSHENPSIRLDLSTEEEHLLREELSQQECEIAIMRSPLHSPPDDSITRVPLFEDRFCVVLSKKHPLAKERVLSLEQLKESQFILIRPVPSRDSISRFQKDLLADLGFPPKYSMFMLNYTTILDLVRHNVGVTIMSDLAARYELKADSDLVRIPLTPSRPYECALYYRNDRPLSSAAAAFISFALEKKDSILPS